MHLRRSRAAQRSDELTIEKAMYEFEYQPWMAAFGVEVYEALQIPQCDCTEIIPIDLQAAAPAG